MTLTDAQMKAHNEEILREAQERKDLKAAYEKDHANIVAKAASKVDLSEIQLRHVTDRVDVFLWITEFAFPSAFESAETEMKDPHWATASMVELVNNTPDCLRWDSAREALHIASTNSRYGMMASDFAGKTLNELALEALAQWLCKKLNDKRFPCHVRGELRIGRPPKLPGGFDK